MWRSFCEVAAVPALANDVRFASGASRVANRAETVATVAAIVRQRPRDAWLALLETHGIPCAPLHTLGELDKHPHTAASDMILHYQHRSGRDLKAVATPLRIDGQRSALFSAPPALGEHSCAILRELVYDDGLIAQWVAQRIVVDGG